MRTMFVILVVAVAALNSIAFGEPRLSAADVVKLSDAEMWRQRGNQLFSYTHAAPLYLPAAHAWEVRYRRKPSEKIDTPAVDPHRDAPLASEKPGTPEEELVVTIDDTTGYASLNFGSQKSPVKK